MRLAIAALLAAAADSRNRGRVLPMDFVLTHVKHHVLFVSHLVPAEVSKPQSERARGNLEKFDLDRSKNLQSSVSWTFIQISTSKLHTIPGDR